MYLDPQNWSEKKIPRKSVTTTQHFKAIPVPERVLWSSATSPSAAGWWRPPPSPASPLSTSSVHRRDWAWLPSPCPPHSPHTPALPWWPIAVSSLYGYSIYAAGSGWGWHELLCCYSLHGHQPHYLSSGWGWHELLNCYSLHGNQPNHLCSWWGCHELLCWYSLPGKQPHHLSYWWGCHEPLCCYSLPRQKPFHLSSGWGWHELLGCCGCCFLHGQQPHHLSSGQQLMAAVEIAVVLLLCDQQTGRPAEGQLAARQSQRWPNGRKKKI